MKTLQDWKTFELKLRTEESFAPYSLGVYDTKKVFVEEQLTNLDDDFDPDYFDDELEGFEASEPLIHVLSSDGYPKYFHIDEEEAILESLK